MFKRNDLPAAICLAVVSAVLAGACTDPPKHDPGLTTPAATSKFPNWPVKLDNFRFRWSAEPGIDLFTGPAVPVRAYLESHRTGDYTLEPTAVYPGFDEAVAPGPKRPEEQAVTDFQLQNIRPNTPYDSAYKPSDGVYGNEYFHVLELSEIKDGYRAYVCDGYYKVFQDHNGKYIPISTGGKPDTVKLGPTGVKVWRIEFTGHLSTDSVLQQKGPNPAPLDNVFGDWRITGADSDGYWGSWKQKSETDPRDAEVMDRLTRCGNLMPDNAQQRADYYTGERDTLPPVEPAVPGWPDNPV
ncbi:hypothetical protein [Mycobacteroides abscessus]|uniref:hypothetical protein n=1 Tax=Mycobacteroides abscessus TaxID=36809 RepID=UPI001C6C5A13|nr:hypothetical protein [Mycobacteroides abscessus]MBE5438696.1 hypothetical protein [Mycobacteroides abscessus]